MDPISILTSLTVILVIGIIAGLIAKKLQIPNMLLLIIVGMILKNSPFEFDLIADSFLITVSLLTMVMIVFDGSSRLNIKELDTYSMVSIQTTVLVVVFNLLFLSVATYYLFGFNSMLLSILFAGVMSGTDPSSVLMIFKNKSNKITDLLKFESIINTPIVVLIPFLILDLMQIGTIQVTSVIDQALPFLQQIVVAIGTGVFVGIIVFRGMKHFYSEQVSPLLLITSSLLTYILAKNLDGNGVLAVTVLGLMFGNIYIKHKTNLQEFSSMLSNSFEILVFIFVGFFISFSFEPDFLIKSIVLYLIMLLIRLGAVYASHLHDNLNFKNMVFMAFNSPKGIAVAVVVFLLNQDAVFMSNVESKTILNLILLFLIYSLIFSTVLSKFSKFFINLKIEAWIFIKKDFSLKIMIMKKIIIDTNFLLIPFNFKVDIFSEIDRICDFSYEVCILKGTLYELNNIINNQRGKDKVAARMAIDLIKQKDLKMLDNSENEYLDDSILKLANKDTIVATQDKELKKRLKKKGIQVIILRNKKYLEII